MNVGLVTWAYPPEKSGLSRAAREIAEALCEAGHDVRVITMDRAGRDRMNGVEVIGARVDTGVLPRLRRWTALGHLVGPAMVARAVRRAHAERPFDVVEATNWYAPGLWVALLGPAPLVTRNSTPVSTSAARGRTMRQRIDRAVAVAVERFSARASGAAISNTLAHGQKIARLYGIPAPGQRHAVIGLSLPPDIVARGTLSTYPPLRADPVELLFVGRNEPRKGTDALLAALPMLAADADAGRLPSFRLTLVGLHASELPTFSETVLRRVRCHHRLPDADLHDALSAAHVVVAPSRYESFGLVYQEAMLFGRPIAACAEDPSARLFVGEAGAGLLADDCTADALGAVLRRLIAEPELRERLSRAGRAAAGRFTRATLAAETQAVYASVVKRRRSASSSSGRPAPTDIAS